jgi:hypothetical protein
MPTLDVWSNSATTSLRDLLSSALACTLLRDQWELAKPVYICSPWITDFTVFDNRYGQFETLTASMRGRSSIRFGDVLLTLSRKTEIRIISKETEATRQFLINKNFPNGNIFVKMADESLHEKGLLTPDFYLEGSMNLTYSGVNLNREKVSYHAGVDRPVIERMAAAYAELNRQWLQLV